MSLHPFTWILLVSKEAEKLQWTFKSHVHQRVLTKCVSIALRLDST